MTYEEICSRNKYFYGKLEEVSQRLLAASEDESLEIDIIKLRERKENLKKEIEIGLDALEEYWMLQRIRKSKQNYAYRNRPLSLKEKSIIEEFLKNPHLDCRELASLSGFMVRDVYRATTKYLIIHTPWSVLNNRTPLENVK